MGDSSQTASSAPTGTSVAAPGVTQAAPAVTVSRDWQKEYEALAQDRLGEQKKLKALESQLAESKDFQMRIQTALGGDKKDPAAELTALRSQATASELLARRAITEAAVVRLAALEGALDADDVVKFVGDIEIDMATGRVKDSTALTNAIAHLKTNKPYLFKPATSPPAGADKGPPLPAARAPNITAPGQVPPTPTLTRDFLIGGDLSEVRKALANHQQMSNALGVNRGG